MRHKILSDFETKMDVLISGDDQTSCKLSRKRIKCQEDFAVPADHRVGIKEREKIW